MKVTLGEQAKPVVPGMSCKLTLVAYDKQDAITVPATAVFEDEAKGTRDIVYVKKGEATPEKRKVVIGQKTEQQWEVRGGTPGRRGDSVEQTGRLLTRAPPHRNVRETASVS